MDDQKLVNDVTAHVAALDRRVHALAAESQRRYRISAEPGTVMHTFDEYEAADTEGREAIADACHEAYEQILEDVDRHIADIERTMSAPASADDVSTVNFTLARENVTRDELQALLDRYRTNHQLAGGIVERAHRDHLHLDNEPEAVRIFRDDASQAAGRVLTRYGKGAYVYPASEFADDVAHALHRIDMFGRAY